MKFLIKRAYNVVALGGDSWFRQIINRCNSSGPVQLLLSITELTVADPLVDLLEASLIHFIQLSLFTEQENSGKTEKSTDAFIVKERLYEEYASLTGCEFHTQ